MRKLAPLILFLALVTSATATSIDSENVTIDVQKKSVNVNMDVRELTSSKFTYITSFPVSSIEATINGEKADCTAESLQIGSEIKCDTSEREDLDIELNITAEQLTTTHDGQIHVFRYDQPIYRPVENYRVSVILPEKTVLLDQKNSTTPIVTPTNYDVESNGRRIFINWEMDPDIGQTASFKVAYEGASAVKKYGNMIPVVLIMLIAGIVAWKTVYAQEETGISYEGLPKDERDIVEMLLENDGEMLQKDIVENSGYSKAKISEVVSKLTEDEIVIKEKEGRSNKITLKD